MDLIRDAELSRVDGMRPTFDSLGVAVAEEAVVSWPLRAEACFLAGCFVAGCLLCMDCFVACLIYLLLASLLDLLAQGESTS